MNQDILREIEELYRRTPKHIDGSILGSMTTWPHPIGVEVFSKFMHVNGNDPELFPAIEECEKKLIREVGSLYGATHGLFTSGGTESNILAVWIAISKLKNRRVVAPSTVHKSIDKACKLIGCELIKIPTHPLKPVDPRTIDKYVTEKQPSLIVITAGTTESGVIDPLVEIAEIAEKHGVFLHIDAAYGGLLIPFLYKRGVVKERLWMEKGVTSITVDLHKNGMAPIPSSILFVKDKDLVEEACFEMDYMPRGRSCGLLGTRPGGSLIASYFVWRAVGPQGYEEIALRMMELASFLYEELAHRPFIDANPYVLPIITFRSRRYNTQELFTKLFKNGLYVYKAPSLDAVRVVIMPHHKKEHLERFIAFLDKIHGE